MVDKDLFIEHVGYEAKVGAMVEEMVIAKLRGSSRKLD